MSRSAVILIVGSLISVGSGQWTWGYFSMPRVVTKAVGDTVWLGPTNPADMPIHYFHWYFQGMPIAGSSSGDYNASDMDRVRLHRHNLTLEIRELALNDTGTYVLHVNYDYYDAWHEEETYLHVLEGGHGGEPEGEPEGGPEGGLTWGVIAVMVCGLLLAVTVGLVLFIMVKLRTVWELPRLADEMRLSEVKPSAAL